ncbi:MAG: hypothetical protein WC492_03805 [Candidatus Micrarchaeia archaeon]
MELKGQLSAEFLIILGVVLLVALVAVSLSIFFTQSSQDISQTESSAYWSTQAQPVRIVDMEGYYYASTPSSGEISLLLENIDSKPITIKSFVLEPYGSETTFNVYSNHSSAGSTTGLTLYGTAGASALTGLSITLAPSERKSVYLRTAVACSDTTTTVRTSTSKYYNDFTIYYDTPYFSGLSFKGLRPISGRCNPN